MRRRRIAIAAAAMGFSVAGVSAAGAMPIAGGHVSASSAVPTGRVADSQEAWFSLPSGDICLPFLGCLPLPLPLPSTFPVGTLHVGVTVGKESARAYVVPAIPPPTAAKTATEGQLRLPVDSSPLAGTLDAGSAHIKVCLTTGRLARGVSGRASGTPPAIDCHVSAPARYDRSGEYFYVDLHPFLARWQRGTPNRGVAIVPNTAGDSPLANWHVAFDGKGGATPQIFSLLSYRVNTPSTPSPSPTPSTTVPDGSTAVPPVDVPLPGTTGVAPSQPAPTIAPPAESAVYFVRSTKFRYPAIFLAPLAILAGAIFFGRLFTSTTVRPRTRPTMGADSSDG